MPGKRISTNVAELIYFNHCNGKSILELSQMFQLTRQTIYNVIKRAEKEGRFACNSSNGRPNKLSQRNERLLVRKVAENPRLSTRQLATDMKEDCSVVVSHETIRKVLYKHKYSSRIARKKPLLTDDHKTRRLKFAMEHINYEDQYWDDTIFCDESKIMLFNNEGPNKVWRKRLEALKTQNIIPTIKFGKLSVMVWGCFSSKGVGDLIFIDGHMDASQYLSILRTNLLNSAAKFGFVNQNKNDFKLYQDNDPKHKAHAVKMWLLFNCKKVLDTPAQSPDLNPIENLWAFLKKR